MINNTQKLLAALNYQFKDTSLLELALTHRSVGQLNNERLEYLGDALLGFVIADHIFKRFVNSPEGELTRMRANLVKKETLAKLAKKLDLGSYLYLGTGEKKSGGWRRDSILANTFEALIGAIYLDSDFTSCKNCLLDIYKDLLQDISPDSHTKDPKTRLQELLQARKLALPIYNTIKEEGEAHLKTFTVECKIESVKNSIVATGRSKRIAEQSSAEQALQLLEEELS